MFMQHSQTLCKNKISPTKSDPLQFCIFLRLSNSGALMNQNLMKPLNCNIKPRGQGGDPQYKTHRCNQVSFYSDSTYFRYVFTFRNWSIMNKNCSHTHNTHTHPCDTNYFYLSHLHYTLQNICDNAAVSVTRVGSELDSCLKLLVQNTDFSKCLQCYRSRRK